MKKRVFLAIILLIGLLALVLTSSLVSAQLDVNSVDKAVKKIEKTGDTLTNDQQRSAYLSQEWNKMLQGTQIGKILDSIAGFFKVLNPVFSVIIGEEFSWGWLFFLTLIVYFLLISSGFSLFTGLEPFFIPYKLAKLYKWILFIVFLIAISTIRIPKFLATLLISFISGVGDWWIQLISIIVIFLIIIILTKFSNKLKAISRLSKKKRKELDLERKTNKEKKEIESIKKKVEKLSEKDAEDEEEENVKKQARNDFKPQG